ncbi:MAG TPA: DUF4031 domain-containing protein [Frateuria sp.]|uniref:DUF4031 domain-containing protein n=1 Tax=Frateuria sp. TaxID=2211372 RepID=UPI002D7FEF19|nr:DUF4031 domain-containing protein [Frateuria sp.]HET6807236.1 DUF4031 domain-containing protein [Frateuria sp.]
MTVYVDDMRAPLGRMVMCHMVADTDDELHAMARQLGLPRRYHQAPPKVRNSHYDICLAKRVRAVELGAVQITARQLAAMCRQRRETGSLGTPPANLTAGTLFHG